MKLFLFVIFHLIIFNSVGQKKYYIKLIDSYCFEQIKLNNTFKINRRNFKIDSINNLIILKRRIRSQFTISSADYETSEEKIKYRNKTSDTIKIALKPKNNLIKEGYNKFWNADSTSTKIIQLNNINSLDTKILTYLNYLLLLEDKCDNGLCSYSNTYQYKFDFERIDSLYVLTKITKIQPRDYKCEVLEKHMDLLLTIFPKFTMTEEKEKFYLRFLISM
ncbi:MAG: hypothetical protein EBQ94_13655 [Flavobacteriales bacterium]|nr:hypothetical protein [Flavobacteriales bacterium]